MFVSIARQVIKPECLGKYHALVKELIEASRVEKGCVSYLNVQSEDDERVHLFIECWENQEAMDAHFVTEHFTRIIPQFAPMFAEPEQVNRYLPVT